jgi:hypothetical protein
MRGHVIKMGWSAWISEPKNVAQLRRALGAWILIGSAFVCMAVSTAAWLGLSDGMFYANATPQEFPDVVFPVWAARIRPGAAIGRHG